jgi:hypothetical protein
VGPRQPESDEEVVPSIESQNTPAIVEAETQADTQANTSAAVPAQRPSQTLRRSARLRQNPRVLIADIPATHFDPAVHFSSNGASLRDLSNKYAKASVEDKPYNNTAFKARKRAFLEVPRPKGLEALVKAFDRASRKKQSLALESTESPIETSKASRNSTVGTIPGADKQKAEFKYFDRDHPANYGDTFISKRSDSSTSSSRNASDAQALPNSDYFPICALNYSGSSEPDKISSCAFPACPCSQLSSAIRQT